MASAFLHGNDFAAILPPLMTFGPSSQMALAGETYKTHTFMLKSHCLISQTKILEQRLLSLPAQLPAWEPDTA